MTINLSDDVSLCPVCSCEFLESEATEVCPVCETPHHKDCWEYAGGCAIFGCRKASVQRHESSSVGQAPETSVDLALIEKWQWYFKAQWLAFFVLSATFTTTLLAVATVIVLQMMAALFSGSIASHALLSLCEIFKVIGFFGFLSSFFPAAAYVLISIPAYMVNILFDKLSLKLPSLKGNTARLVARRVESSGLIGVSDSFHKGFLAVARAIALTSGFVGIFKLIVGPGLTGTWFASMIVILFAVAVSYATFANCIESRIAYITTFQNRLAASSKKFKG